MLCHFFNRLRCFIDLGDIVHYNLGICHHYPCLLFGDFFFLMAADGNQTKQQTGYQSKDSPCVFIHKQYPNPCRAQLQDGGDSLNAIT